MRNFKAFKAVFILNWISTMASIRRPTITTSHLSSDEVSSSFKTLVSSAGHSSEYEDELLPISELNIKLRLLLTMICLLLIYSSL